MIVITLSAIDVFADDVVIDAPFAGVALTVISLFACELSRLIVATLSVNDNSEPSYVKVAEASELGVGSVEEPLRVIVMDLNFPDELLHIYSSVLLTSPSDDVTVYVPPLTEQFSSFVDVFVR